MKIGAEYTERYWRPAYLEAVTLLSASCAPHAIPVEDAAQRWLVHHSLLDAAHGDGVILGASSVEQLQANLVACVNSEPLPPTVVQAFEQVRFEVHF